MDLIATVDRILIGDLFWRFFDRDPINQIMEDKYPNLVDKLDDLDVCLSLIHYIAYGPPWPAITSALVTNYQRLCSNWQSYISKTNSLRKVICSNKGVDLVVQVERREIIWRIPHKSNIPVEIHDGTCAAILLVHRYFKELLDSVLSQLCENNDPKSGECKSLFKDLKFFISPCEAEIALRFVISSLGGQVCGIETDEGITHQVVVETDDRITEQIHVAGMSKEHYSSRVYVAPTWVYASANTLTMPLTQDYSSPWSSPHLLTPCDFPRVVPYVDRT